MKSSATIKSVLVLSMLASTLTGCAVQQAAAEPVKDRNHADHPQSVEFFVAPHEDDEWEMWSQVENRPNVFKVFIVLARGEQTAFCLNPAGAKVGLQAALGEIPPSPTPLGQWTPSCSQARLNSWLGFFGDMSMADPTVPGSFAEPTTTREFPDDGANVCRHDGPLDANGNQTVGCTSVDRSALVWADTKGRGSLVSFDLGEGDETAPEIAWAINAVLDNPTEFGIPAGLKSSALWGGYANVDNPDCFEYANVDHVALHAALHAEAFPVPQQGAATCATSPGVNVRTQVSYPTMNYAFQVSEAGVRIGAHARRYGWLNESWYHLSPTDPSQLFQGAQTFWTVTK